MYVLICINMYVCIYIYIYIYIYIDIYHIYIENVISANCYAIIVIKGVISIT